jgi:hypothetical protein
MRHTRLSLLAPLAAVVAIAASPGALKDPVGVYGVIDRVVFEPDSISPERIQLWGVFALSNAVGVKDGKIDRIDMHTFYPAQAGYLYYEVNPHGPDASQAEWRALARLAATGDPVAFGSRFPPTGTAAPLRSATDVDGAEAINRYNGRVRDAAEAATTPDPFPLRMEPGLSLRAGLGHAVVAEVLRIHAESRTAVGDLRR